MSVDDNRIRKFNKKFTNLYSLAMKNIHILPTDKPSGLFYIDKNLFYSKFSHCKVLPNQIVDSGCSRIERTSERRTLCSKNDFAEYVTSNFEKFNFENFKLIYELIYKIIQENNIFAEKQ